MEQSSTFDEAVEQVATPVVKSDRSDRQKPVVHEKRDLAKLQTVANDSSLHWWRPLNLLKWVARFSPKSTHLFHITLW